MASNVTQTPSSLAGRIGGRYVVEAPLGRGGMATVVRVWDPVQERRVALKQLTLPEDPSRRKELITLFEGEFQALAQLSHPHVIAVYDYGVEEAGPYYTMELLDGGDLRGRSPLPWREACALMSGVCSSLALIHSRRLVHRDVGPGNVWCTGDGKAKLIDFGALVPMGARVPIVGTAAFVAPEVVHQAPLDARTDLFSLGATLYFALTGRPPYPARTFAQLDDLWTMPLPAPSNVVDGIPDALDALVMSLVSIDPSMRPRTAFEVMQRLTAISGIAHVEPLSVSQAYLSTPVMVGREEAKNALRSRMMTAFGGRGRGLHVEGEPGVGRTRFLETCVVEAKMLAATVLRASAASARKDDFAIAQSLAEQLVRLLPDPTLAVPTSSPVFDAGAPRLERQRALADWLLRVSAAHPLLIAVDDAHEIDEPSAALLGVLTTEARKHRLLVVVTVETGAPQRAPAAIEVLASRSTNLRLLPLTRAETQQLLASLFGDVQNLGLVADGVYRVSAGNPRACMDLARHLVDRRVISYEGGAWTLPARLDPSDLPGTAEEAIRERIGALGPLARWLAETQSLANDTFSREDYRLLRPEAEPTHVDRALSELVSNQILTGDGGLHSLAHRGWALALTATLTPEERKGRHKALAVLYANKERSPLPIVHIRHLLAGGELARGVERLLTALDAVGDPAGVTALVSISTGEVATTLVDALEAAKTLGRSDRELHTLRFWIISLSVGTEDAVYWRVAPEWLAQLERDSGLADWRALGDVDPGSRLARALGAAAQRYATTPEPEQVYRPDEAVGFLCRYVILSIAIGSRSVNGSLLATLPELLAPFVPLSPLVNLIHQNVIATCEMRVRVQFEQARARWADVYEGLGKIDLKEAPYRDVLRNAIAYGIGSLEVRLGIPSALKWAQLLESDPLQQVNALYLRKIAALQLGDSDSAERWRREAEVLALQARMRQMFTTTLSTELMSHVLAEDLTGIKQVIARMQPLTVGSRGWQAYAELAEAQFQQLRGDLEAARERFERCIEMSAPDGTPDGTGARPVLVWPTAAAGYVETLVALGRPQEAFDFGQRALETCHALEIGAASHELSRATALAEGKLARYADAAARLEALIEEQRGLGATGLMLGVSCEARARVAIWAGDEVALETYASLTAKEYRHGRGSSLGARYERLMAEARRVTRRALPALTDFGSGATSMAHRSSPTEMATALLNEAVTAEDRAERALKLICDDRGVGAGLLYLVSDHGLRLAARYGVATPPDGLQDFLGKYLDAEISSGTDDTSPGTGPEPASSREGAPRSWYTEGNDYRPVLMTSLADGYVRHAGVVVLIGDSPTARPAGGAALVAVLSTHLIRSGDTRGIAA